MRFMSLFDTTFSRSTQKHLSHTNCTSVPTNHINNECNRITSTKCKQQKILHNMQNVVFFVAIYLGLHGTSLKRKKCVLTVYLYMYRTVIQITWIVHYNTITPYILLRFVPCNPKYLNRPWLFYLLIFIREFAEKIGQNSLKCIHI